MAKICFLLTTTPWSDRRQFFIQAPSLASNGHEVIYMSGAPEETKKDGFIFKRLSKRTRKRARFTGSLNLFRRIKHLDPDAIQLCSVEQLPLGLLIKFLTKIKVIYDCREDMYNSMRYSKEQYPVWMRIILAKCTKLVEYIAAKTFDGFVVSDPALAEIHSAMPKESKMIFLNTALLSMFPQSYQKLDQREYDVVLLGGMTRRSGFIVLLECLNKLLSKGRRVKTLLIGEPDSEMKIMLDKDQQYNQIRELINITGHVDYVQVPSLLAQAKIGLVLLLDMPKFHNNIACKAFEYMACGMPVISSDLPPERFFLRENQTALFFKPSDTEELVKAVEKLLDDRDMAKSMGETARKEVEEKWNSERYQKEYCKFYLEILRRQPCK